MPLTLAEADDYLSQGLEGLEWAKNDDIQRYKALVSAERFLKSLYPNKTIPDHAIYLQAAWSVSSISDHIRSNVSSVSVSESGVSTSYATSQAGQFKALLCPTVAAMLGEPKGAGNVVKLGGMVF